MSRSTSRDDAPAPPASAPSTGAAAGARLRGVLDLCVLSLVADQPMHGYDLARALADAGVGEVKGGTLYPLLGRLEQRGDLEASWEAGGAGPPRKRYRLTAQGRATLQTDATAWRALAAAVHSLLGVADHHLAGRTRGGPDRSGRPAETFTQEASRADHPRGERR